MAIINAPLDGIEPSSLHTGRSIKSKYVAHYLIALRAKLNDLSQAVEKKNNYLSKRNT